MLLRKGIFLLGVFAMPLIQVNAQSYSETALLFSRTNLTGSSRILSLGGANVSLGGDLSSAFTNPAGLGMFNRGELVINVGSNSSIANSSYLGNSLNSSKSNFSIPFIGMSFYSPKEDSKIISGTFSVALNRINDFNESFSYEGINGNNSMIDYFLNDAYDNNGNAFDPRDLYSPTNLAFNTYLIDTISLNSSLNYWSALGLLPDPTDFRKVKQHEEIITSGTENQWSFSYGINVADKLFLGGGIGLRNIKFESKKTYTESNFEFKDVTYNPINHFTLEENLRITGSGYNATFGIIARPIEGLQIGVAYNSPTVFTLTDVYGATIESQWNNFDYYQSGTLILKSEISKNEEIVTDYKLKTPSKLNAGASLFIGKKGFITAEIETMNFASSKYTSKTTGVSFDGDNEDIKILYNSILNYHAGAEYRLNKLRFRSGIYLQPDPFLKKQNELSRQITTVSAGIGYRDTGYYIDLAVTYSWGNSSYRPYRINSPTSPLVTSENKTILAQVTLGIPFQ